MADSKGADAERDWLGIELGSRALLEAGHTGWIRPETADGHLREVGVKRFVGMDPASREALAENEIPVRLRIDPDRLWATGDSGPTHVDYASRTYMRVQSCPFPVSAVSGVLVPSRETEVRLKAMMARFKSTLRISDADWGVDTEGAGAAGRPFDGAPSPADWSLPANYDRVRGAMSAAVWAGAWGKLLPVEFREALGRVWGGDGGGFSEWAEWCSFPWLHDPSSREPDASLGQAGASFDACLWRGFLAAEAVHPGGGSRRSELIVEQLTAMGHGERAKGWADWWNKRMVRSEGSFVDDALAGRISAAWLAVSLSGIWPERAHVDDLLEWREQFWLTMGPAGSGFEVKGGARLQWDVAFFGAAVALGWTRGYAATPPSCRGTWAHRERVAADAMAVAWAQDPECVGDAPRPVGDLALKREAGSPSPGL